MSFVPVMTKLYL